MKNTLGWVCIVLFALFAVTWSTAAPKKEARVTQVIKEVRVLAGNAAPRAATLNDQVVEGNAVRTGGDSRAELTFADQTLTRIGENTVFSFGQGGKQFDLASGAMLLAVPKQGSDTRVSVGAATAAVSGFTALFERGRTNKMIILEGRGTVSFKGVPGPCQIESGQMIIWPTHPTRCPEVHTVDVNKVVKSAKLITQFRKLPPWSLTLIEQVINNQQTSPPPGRLSPDPTGIDAVDQKNSGEPSAPPLTPRITKPPGGTPPGQRPGG